MTSKSLILSAFAALVLILAAIEGARACCIVSPMGKSVSIASENAVIIWDETSRVEHFIRKVEFKAQGNSLGFLVPTPAKPDIAEADDAVFGRLKSLLPPPPTAQRTGRITDGGMDFDSLVKVIERKRVAGMDVAVLETSDAAALNSWLKENGFPSRPAIQQWLEPYVRMGFKIAAFKYAKAAANDPEIATKAVRISFAVTKPFYPYRMPADTDVNRSQVLRVFVIASKTVRGLLTEGASKHSWGNMTHTQPVTQLPWLFAGALPADKIPKEPLQLTVFDDHNVMRTGPAELYFENSL